MAMAESLPEDWDRWKGQVDLTGYDERWQRMAEAGENPHGEADLVSSFRPSSVLDAGCGTGRVGIELAQRGMRVVGVDADADMIAAARAKAPDLDWRHVDLAALDLTEQFDVVVLAGNVVPYVAADDRPAAVVACARALAPGGRLIAGFSLRPDWPTAGDYDAWCVDAGLELEDRFATWAGSERFTDQHDYLVAIYRAA
ncbi:class I SAM-dependent methyltransferase [Pseudonocardia spinosispora]|uniref:class I SAM-dependent methyltransferase n=1 Tax=Pseudonocardia spinosispora TaxID=103441 RepID=UPI001FDFA243|nr:class I SAM-dependent methyltransferase [Pseudonocardia spinosispora]